MASSIGGASPAVRGSYPEILTQGLPTGASGPVPASVAASGMSHYSVSELAALILQSEGRIRDLENERGIFFKKAFMWSASPTPDQQSTQKTCAQLYLECIKNLQEEKEKLKAYADVLNAKKSVPSTTQHAQTARMVTPPASSSTPSGARTTVPYPSGTIASIDQGLQQCINVMHNVQKIVPEILADLDSYSNRLDKHINRSDDYERMQKTCKNLGFSNATNDSLLTYERADIEKDLQELKMTIRNIKNRALEIIKEGTNAQQVGRSLSLEKSNMLDNTFQEQIRSVLIGNIESLESHVKNLEDRNRLSVTPSTSTTSWHPTYYAASALPVAASSTTVISTPSTSHVVAASSSTVGGSSLGYSMAYTSASQPINPLTSTTVLPPLPSGSPAKR